jgi:hypothetical protein
LQEEQLTKIREIFDKEADYEENTLIACFIFIRKETSTSSTLHLNHTLVETGIIDPLIRIMENTHSFNLKVFILSSPFLLFLFFAYNFIFLLSLKAHGFSLTLQQEKRMMLFI